MAARARLKGRRRLAQLSVLAALTILAFHCNWQLGGFPGAVKVSRRSLLDVRTPARVHGRVKKAGPVGVLTQLGQGQAWNELLFPPDWIKERIAGNNPIPPSAYANPMINDEYKIIYVKSPKVAGTTIMDGYFSHCDLPRRYKYCLHMLDFTNTTEIQHALEVWDEYFVFGFSRNVLSRALSQYSYLSTFVKEECTRLTWDQYCEDPYLIGDICSKTDSKGESCCTIVPEHNYLHVEPQVNSLATIDNEWAVDYVGRVEHFYEDFLELLSALNAREGVPKVPEELPAHLNTQPDECNLKSKQNSTECNKMVHFTGQHEHCYASITKFYEADITLLGHAQ